MKSTRLNNKAAFIAFLLFAIGLGLIAAYAVSRSDEPLGLREAFRDRRYDEADRVVEAWRKASPKSAEAAYWRGRLALAGRLPREFDEALKQAEALGLDRSRLDLLKALSTALAGRFAEVEPRLRDAFNALDPDVLVLDALASGYLETYDFPRASLVLNRWLAASPSDPIPYLRRAEIDIRKSDQNALIVDYREALKRDSSLAKARLGLAEALRETHRVEEAARVVADYLKAREDDPAGQCCAARIADERGNTDEAAERYERALSLDPENAASRKAYGDFLLRQGKVDQALVQLEKAKEIDPFDRDVRHALGLVLIRLGRLDEAKVEQATAARLRGELQTMLAAQAILLKDPGRLESRLAISRWMFDHGQGEQGRIWATSILKDHPGEPEACRLLALFHDRKGETGLANYYRLQAEQAGKSGRSKG